jgi:hypothetical protein
MRKQVVESWERLVADELAALEADVDADDADLDIEGRALSFDRKGGRWELDPASADDYDERHRSPLIAQKWRHFGH